MIKEWKCKWRAANTETYKTYGFCPAAAHPRSPKGERAANNSIDIKKRNEVEFQ